MFTGIVAELGEVADIASLTEDAVLTVRAPLIAGSVGHGDSIAVNGVCLTVVDTADGCFTADVMPETLSRSSLAELTVGGAVNLERAVRADERLDGHIVQGHVDGTARITAREPGARWEVVWLTLPEAISRYVAEKGSIAVDGVSLTVCDIEPDRFSVSLIPTTLELTTLGRKAVGDAVNLEVDVIAKYTERLTAAARRRDEAPA